MNIFEQCFTWHPQWAIYPLSENNLRLLSETESLVLSRKQFTPLNRLIEANMLLKDWSMQQSLKKALSIHQQLELNQLLAAMLEAGYITATEKPDNSHPYHTPNFAQQALVVKGHGKWPQIQVLSQYDNLDMLLGWLKPIEHDHAVNLVIVDDYLDPRLAAINRHYRQAGEPWLLLKLTGEQAMVGPYFTGEKGGEKNQACWQCLHHRMRANAGLRCLQYDAVIDSDSPPLAIPVKYDEATIERHIGGAMALLLRLLEEKISTHFYQISEADDEPVKHPIIHRPQCPCCGDADHYQRQTEQPVTLQSSIKLMDKDGGVRIIEPKVTVERLKKVISPLSGLLTHLDTLSIKQQHYNVIFRSGFNQCPQNLDYLTAPLSSLSYSYTTTGKGISVHQSQASGLSEGIERLAAQYQGDEISHFAVAPVDDPDYILPQQLTAFSAGQYEAFSRQALAEYQLYAVKVHDGDVPLYWTPVWSLTDQRQRFVPLSFCYANSPNEEQQYCRYYHNGGAAGNTFEEAVLQGFLEIVERDAVAIWWYNQVPRPAIDFTQMSPELLLQLQHTLAPEWDYWALDLTHDFTIPVVATVSRHKKTGKYCFGFGCHLDVQIACQRAFTELFQITEIRDNHSAPFDFDQIPTGDYLLPNDQPLRQFSDFVTLRNRDIKDDIDYCLRQATMLDLETLVLNYSRADMPLKTSKVIIPGCCHIFGYFAAPRLYQVPVSMGWLGQAKTEVQLNLQALLI